MGESAASVGVWLASDFAKIATGDRDTVSVLVLCPFSLREVLDIVTPLSKKLNNGVTVYAKGFTEKPADAPQRMRFKKLESGEWDVIVLGPHVTETMGTRALRTEVMSALNSVKLSDRSRVVICAPTTAETNPVALRVRVYVYSGFDRIVTQHDFSQRN